MPNTFFKPSSSFFFTSSFRQALHVPSGPSQLLQAVPNWSKTFFLDFTNQMKAPWGSSKLSFFTKSAKWNPLVTKTSIPRTNLQIFTCWNQYLHTFSTTISTFKIIFTHTPWHIRNICDTSFSTIILEKFRTTYTCFEKKTSTLTYNQKGRGNYAKNNA